MTDIERGTLSGLLMATTIPTTLSGYYLIAMGLCFIACWVAQGD